MTHTRPSVGLIFGVVGVVLMVLFGLIAMWQARRYGRRRRKYTLLNTRLVVTSHRPRSLQLLTLKPQEFNSTYTNTFTKPALNSSIQ
jgi:hypothetical protein